MSADRRAILIDRLDEGQLDLALLLHDCRRSDAQIIATLPMAWIGPGQGKLEWAPDEPLPLAVFNPPCFFHETTIAALDRASIPWHISFTSPSLHGLWAAVDAGLGVTVRTAEGLPNRLLILPKSFGLPPLATTQLSLHDAGRELTPATARFKEILLETLAANLPAASKVKRNFT